jgi:multiple sugar transport system ATP-binding protein
MATIEFDHVSKVFPDGTVAVADVSLTIGDGEFVILVGPSGCGKTTALRMVAGLEEISSGELRIGGRRVNEVDAPDRDIALVFQNYALYPHMSVRDNIAFPLRVQRIKRAEKEARVREAAALLGIEDLLGRKPRELSGGQRQRVAMGRAIIRHPQVFLMDEPLSNLDAKLRVQMRGELVKLHRRLGVTTLYVTHDQTEAMTLGQRVAVLNRGVVQQVAAPKQLYNEPANTFVAGFIGSPSMNFVPGTVGQDAVDVGGIRLPLPSRFRGRQTADRADVLVGLRPEAFADFVDGDDETVVEADIEVTEELGNETYTYFRIPGIEATNVGERAVELAGALVARLGPRTPARPGIRIPLAIDTESLHLFDSATGESLQRPAGASEAVPAAGRFL